MLIIDDFVIPDPDKLEASLAVWNEIAVQFGFETIDDESAGDVVWCDDDILEKLGVGDG